MRERRTNRTKSPHAARRVVQRAARCKRRGTRRGKGNVTRWSCYALAGLLLVFVAIAGGFYIRLLQGPIDLAFLTPRITAAIDKELTNGIRMEIGGVVLERGGRTGLTVRLRDIELLDEEGSQFAMISRADVDLDPMALLSGEVAPRRVDLLNPRLHVEETADGGVVMTADSGPVPPVTADSSLPQASAPEDSLLSQLDTATLTGLTRSFASAVEEILSLGGANGNHLEIISLVNGAVSWQSADGIQHLSPVDARLERGIDGGPVKVEVEAGEGEMRVAFGLSAAHGKNGRKKVRLELREVPQVPIEVDESESSGLSQLLIPVEATAEVVFAEDGSLVEGNGRLQVSARPAKPGAKPVIRDADLLFTLDPAGRRLVLEQSRLAIAEGDGTVSGAVVWPESGNIARDGLTFVVETQDMHLDANDVDAPPLPLDRASVSGALLPAENAIRFDSILLQSGQVEVSGRGYMTLGQESPGLKMDLTTSAIDVAELKQIWPSFVSPGARNWVVDNVVAGRVEPTEFHADYAPDSLHNAKLHGTRLPQDALDLKLAMRDVTFSYFRQFPGVKGMNATATLDGNSFRIAADAGQIQPAESEIIEVEKGAFEVPMIHGDDLMGKVQVSLDGPTQSFANLMAGETGLEVPERLKTLGKVEGTTSLDINVDVLLRRDVRREDVDYLVVAEFGDLTMPKLIGDRSFEKGSVELRIAPSDFKISAKGLLDGVPTTLDIHSDEPPTEKDLGEFSVSLLIDEKTGPRFGLAIGEILTGPILAEIAGTGSLETVDKVALDITNARLGNDGIGTIKPAGRKGQLTFRPVFGEESKELQDIELATEDLSLKGSVTFDAEGDFKTADFTNVNFGRGEDATLSVRKSGSTTKLRIRGESFDLAPIIGTENGMKAKSASGASKSEPDSSSSSSRISLDVDINRLLGMNGESIKNPDFRVSAQGTRILNLEGTGRFASGGAIRSVVEKDSQGPILTVTAADAGAVFRFFDIYKRVKGGQLAMRLRLPKKSSQPMPGVLQVDGFQVVDDPGLKKLATQTAGGGQTRAVQTTGAMSFDRLHLVFHRTPGRTRITEGVVRGPAAGATFRGTVDHQASRVNLTGTFVPAYALNNVFSRIPLFGPLLGGRADEGLVGVTFAMRGNLSDPDVMVNPLSAIAPGLFRHIFEFGQQPPAEAGMVQQPQN